MDVNILNIINLLFNGFLLGGLFALAAFGLSVLAGIMRVINIAHGDFAILAAYLSFTIMDFLGMDPLLSILIVAPIMFAVGYLFQKFTINRVLPMGGNQPVLVTFALSIVIQNILLLVFTADARSIIPSYMLINIDVLGLSPSPRYLLGFVSALIVFIAVFLFFKKTYLGKAMRAVPFDPEAAKMLGIKSEVVYNYAAGLALLVVGIAGVLLGMTFTFYPDTGPTYVLLSFGVVVMGGLGSLKGSLVGGFIMGEALVFGGYLFGSRFQLMFCYLVILAILYLRPQGIFGGKL
ncbi:MAG: branched-chain amino acid ABC transporter permease [Candidatus Bathyarchaeia archaeon]|nr:branched-chain amino acid ABC transporter permease [Candidatus Bathyarchaeota archaeon]